MKNNSKTLWERIADELKVNGIEVYPPATKVGECRSEYVVLKADGSAQIGSFSSKAGYYTFLLYVPKDKYTQLERFKQKVETVLSESLYPMLMPTGQETPDFYDDTVKAHMVSMLYRVSIRDSHL